LSKLPKKPANKEQEKVCGMLCSDALEEFNKACTRKIGNLALKEQKEVGKVFGTGAMQLVSNFLWD
jgi:hypothetical protein